jgi:hypothetical protein
MKTISVAIRWNPAGGSHFRGISLSSKTKQQHEERRHRNEDAQIEQGPIPHESVDADLVEQSPYPK